MARRPKTDDGKPCVRVKITSMHGTELIYTSATNNPEVPAIVERVVKAFLSELDNTGDQS